ncbi:LPP20 family lipoprotein [Catenovulum maritimum]|uniref:LPP20 family lipoprotein n=1 Tax=Catenovulum maritimum TaxID=1513271 RepID=UPI00066062A9|nr:hypothetical protein [Catenovulum maritimum]
MKFKITAFIFSLAFSQNSFAETEYTEFVGANGSVNWTTGKISAIGMGAAPSNKPPHVIPLLSCRAAIADAQRNLLESVKGVRVEASTVVEKYMLANDTITTSVQGVVRGGLIMEKTPYPDSTCKVVIEAPLSGTLSTSIYKDLFEQQTQKSVFYKMLDGLGEQLSWLAPQKAYAFSEQDLLSKYQALELRVQQLEGQLGKMPTNANSAVQYQPTGLVVDVRGSHFRPSLAPKLRTDKGKLLYPTQDDKDTILASGRLVSLFTRDLQFAQRHPSIGDRPLVVKANRAGKDKTDVLFNPETSEKLSRLFANIKGTDLAVIMVLD